MLRKILHEWAIYKNCNIPIRCCILEIFFPIALNGCASKSESSIQITAAAKIQTRILARQTNTTTYYIISSRSPFYCSMCKTFCGGLKTLQCKYFAMFFKARYLSLDFYCKTHFSPPRNQKRLQPVSNVYSRLDGDRFI